MLSLVLRRARVQRGMLVAVVGLVATAACLVGVCTLLVSVTQQRAFHVAIERAQPDDVDVTAFLVDVPGPEFPDALSQAGRVVAGVLAPMHPTVTADALSAMRRIDGNRLAYLAADDEFEQRAALTSGHWPSATATQPPEAVVPDSAVKLLGLRLGSRLTLGQELGSTDAANPVSVVVVGTFQPLAGEGWETDPLSGQGYSPAYTYGSASAPAYGPFVIGDAAFRATGSSVSSLRVTAHPTTSLAERSTLTEAARDVDHASTLLSADLGNRVQISRVASQLPQTLARIDAQQAATRAAVLVVVLLGAALAIAAALLAGWLVAARRDDERALLVALGLSRRQQVTTALTEAVLLAAAAAIVALPAAAVLHALLTHLPDLRAAGLTQRPTITSALVATVSVSSLLFALALVLTSLDTGTATDRGARHKPAIRIGLDVLLAVVAAACWWQLHAQPATAQTSDIVLTSAPALGLAAVTLLAVRVMPAAFATLARATRRLRGLVVPLAAQQAARRPHAGTAMVAIAAAVAALTFGAGLHATWERSQTDQATLLAGSDLSLVPAAGSSGVTEAIEAAAANGSLGHAVSPVIDRTMSLGNYVGTPGSPPMIVGVDAAQAGSLLRGRLDDGRGWGQVGAQLTSPAPVAGIPLPAGGKGVSVTADAPARAALSVTVTAVVQDAAGLRASVTSQPIPMDGQAHEVSWLGLIGPGQRLVAAMMNMVGPGAPETSQLSVSLRVPGTAAGGSWQPQRAPRGSLLTGAGVTLRSAGADTIVQMTVVADLTYFAYSDNAVLVTGFPAPADVPVAVSQALVDAVGTGIGARLTGVVSGTAIQLRVVAIVPDVPSAPGAVAVLADNDVLARALVVAGDLDPVVDAWWVAAPAPDAVPTIEHLHLGDVTTRSEVAAQLAHGPLQVAVPVGLLTLVAVAGLMLLMSVGLLLASDRQRRSTEVSRLRALGLGHGAARRVLLAEDALFLLPLVLVGAVAGIVTSAVLGPMLVRSDVGGAPVPPALAAWPWALDSLLVAGLVVGALAIATAITATHVRRSDPVHLRTDGGQ